MGLDIRSADYMSWNKDRMDLGFSQAQINTLVAGFNADIPQLTHNAVFMFQNTNAESIAERGVAFGNGEPLAQAQMFVTPVRAAGKSILARVGDCYFEGNYHFPKTNFRTGNRFTFFGTDVTDDFSSSVSRDHGYGITSIAGSLSNYVTAGAWSISGSELVGPTANGWYNTCFFNAPYLRDVVMVAKVKKINHQQIIVRGSTDTNFPGYGLQLRDNEVWIERPGKALLAGPTAKVSMTLVEGSWYWMKLEATGTTIRGKVWLDGDAEPGAWTVTATDTNYSVGYCGFSGESNNGHFDSMTITPGVDTQTWMYRHCHWLDTNHTLFATGDIIAPYSEAGQHWGPYGPSNEGSYIQFWLDLEYCIERVMTSHSKTVSGGYFAHLFTGAIQNAFNANYDKSGLATVDHYSSAIGLGQRKTSFTGQLNSGTSTYTCPTAVSEAATGKFTFTPEKSAFNETIDVFVVNPGSGSMTMTIHDSGNNPVTMASNTNISNLTQSYTVTIPNASLVANAYNTFTIPWTNLAPDVGYHLHITSQFGDATVKVDPAHANNLTGLVCVGYKCNAKPEAFEIDIRNLAARTGHPVFLQETGDFWSIDPTRSTPVRTQAEHIAYLRAWYAAFQRCINDGVLKGINYWRTNGGYESLLTNVDQSQVGTATYSYALIYTGIEFQTFMANNAASPTAPAAPSSLVLSVVSDTAINLSWTDNSSNETGFKIERKTGVGGTYAQIFVTGPAALTYSDTGLTAATTYYYRVRATNGTGDSSYLTEQHAATNAAPLPVVAPVIAPNGGTYLVSVLVTLTCATPGTTLYYTTDGSTPNATKTLYTVPFHLTANATLKVIGIKAGESNSSVTSATFTVSPNPPTHTSSISRRRRKELIAVL